MLAFSLCTLRLLDEVAPPCAGPKSFQEPDAAIFGIRAVVSTQNWLDSLGSLVGIVEWDSGNKVVDNVRLNDTVKKVPSDKPKFTVNGSGSTTGEVPSLVLIMWEGRIGVLEESNSN